MPRVLRVKGRARARRPVQTIGPPTTRRARGHPPVASPSVFGDGAFDDPGQRVLGGEGTRSFTRPVFDEPAGNDVFGPAPPSAVKVQQARQRFLPGDTPAFGDIGREVDFGRGAGNFRADIGSRGDLFELLFGSDDTRRPRPPGKVDPVDRSLDPVFVGRHEDRTAILDRPRGDWTRREELRRWIATFLLFRRNQPDARVFPLPKPSIFDSSLLIRMPVDMPPWPFGLL